RSRHTRLQGDWSSDVCSSDLVLYHRGNGSMGALKYVMMDRFFNHFGGATEAVGRYCGGEGDRGVVQSLGESVIHDPIDLAENTRSEERRVGKECRAGVWPDAE